MFRKLVSAIPFSPSLMDDLASYRSKFGKELSLRSITVFLAFIFLCAQLFVLLSPAQSTLSASGNDLVYDGGGKTPEAIINAYTTNRDLAGNTDIQTIYSTAGITKADLSDYRLITIDPFENGEYWILGRSTRGTTQEKEIAVTDNLRLFARQLYELSSKKPMQVMEVSTKNGLRWIALESGNVILPNLSSIPKLQKQSREKCTAVIDNCFSSSVKAINVTQGSPAESADAQSGDSIEYTFITTNTATTPQKVRITQNLNDVLEYADIIDATGATFSSGPTKNLSWPAVTVQPKESVVRTLLVKIKSPLPRTPTATSDPLSYNQNLSTRFGNTLTIALPSTTAKTLEQFAAIAPPISPLALFFATIALFITSTLLYVRSRLLYKELWIITHEFNGKGH